MEEQLPRLNHASFQEISIPLEKPKTSLFLNKGNGYSGTFSIHYSDFFAPGKVGWPPLK